MAGTDYSDGPFPKSDTGGTDAGHVRKNRKCGRCGIIHTAVRRPAVMPQSLCGAVPVPSQCKLGTTELKTMETGLDYNFSQTEPTTWHSATPFCSDRSGGSAFLPPASGDPWLSAYAPLVPQRPRWGLCGKLRGRRRPRPLGAPEASLTPASYSSINYEEMVRSLIRFPLLMNGLSYS